MALNSLKKKDIISQYHLHKKDTGSAKVQVALLTGKINSLTQHLRSNVKDTHSRYGLIKMVGQRKRLLDYLRRSDSEKYRELLTSLDLRK